MGQINPPAKTRVLVVEDEPMLQRFYRAIFDSSGGRAFEPLIVSDCPQALAALERERFDLAVLDWSLPTGEGIGLAKAIRADERTCEVGILMVTGRSSGAETILALKAGADDHLAKPFDPDMFLMRLHGLARRKSLGGDAGAAIDADAPLTILERNLMKVFLTRRPPLTMEELESALWGGDRVRRELLEEVLQSLRRKLGPAWAPRLRVL